MHLTMRVAWHDNKWNGTVCNAPKNNSFCIALNHIRLERDDAKDEQLAKQPWSELKPDQMPPCIGESGGFMSPHSWTMVIIHPYQNNRNCKPTHGHLKPTSVNMPPFSTLAVPFWWMLRGNQKKIDESLSVPLPLDEQAPFESPWVFGRARQEALSKLFFQNVQDGKSLVFFYCKEGTPLGDRFSRLIVGVGTVVKVGPVLYYDSNKSPTYAIWDRVIKHSILPNGYEGFVLPYHEYLEPTGDPKEDLLRMSLLEEIAVEAPPDHINSFSYVSTLAGHDVALSTLIRCLRAVRKIREHGIVRGPWEQREEWLNQQIATEWKNRGAFPGLGSALEALGMRLGTALTHELTSNGRIKSNENPWPALDAILRGEEKPPNKAYEADLKAISNTWEGLSEERRQLLELLSRFEFRPCQAIRWFDRNTRYHDTGVQIEDSEIIKNPYRISEVDLNYEDGPAISIGTIDKGLLPDDTVRSHQPVPLPSAVGSKLDHRRVRAALVSVLRTAANNGDSLLSVTEAIERLQNLDLAESCNPSFDWIEANVSNLAEVIELLRLPVNILEPEKVVLSLQLTELKNREEYLQKILRARAGRLLGSLEVDWKSLLVDAIRDSGGYYDDKNSRHISALEEQAKALEKITTKKLSVLVGRAGTGKTSVLGALLRCKTLVAGGILLLAPTGKARVKLGKAAGSEAETVAQFLNGLGRYDISRQCPLFTGEKYQKEKTIVIDECSMLTMDDLAAILEALDLGHVQRIILVGDPNQLPPIGVGRPFADLVASLEESAESTDVSTRRLSESLGRLTVEVRATAGSPSDTLRLASWFTRDPQPVDADRVLSDLEFGIPFNDLEVVFWETPDELHERLLEQFQIILGLNGVEDIEGFNRALGLSEKGGMSFNAPEGAENFQILSPIRMHPHGVYDLNRWTQRQFRAEELKNAKKSGEILGDEKIVIHDKVIQNCNQRRYAYDGKSQSKIYLANGEIGIVAFNKNKYMNVVFAGRPGYTIGYTHKDFPSGSGPLELAYALTVHKSQGSEFRYVFVVLPKNCRILSRELLYTALTRSRDHLVLLVEGNTASSLYEFTKPESSETTRRNTNLFRLAIREHMDTVPYAEHLIHKCDKGHMVRSKSELVIANKLWQMGIDYEYERPVEGEVVPGKMRPDFSFVDPAGDLILWEHLGMLFRDDYRKSWEWKKDWYAKNGFIEGENLFTTQDDDNGGLDSTKVTSVAEIIKNLI